MWVLFDICGALRGSPKMLRVRRYVQNAQICQQRNTRESAAYVSKETHIRADRPGKSICVKRDPHMCNKGAQTWQQRNTREMECVYTRGKNMFYFPGLFARMWVSFDTHGTIGPSVLATCSVGSRKFKWIYIRSRGKGKILSPGRLYQKNVR